MGYTTAADVQKYFLGLKFVDSKGNPTNTPEADFDQFIEEQSAIIDLKIAAKYILPITNANDLTYLKLVCDKLVACQIDKKLRTFATDDESEFVRRRDYCKEAHQMLEDLINGDVVLNSPQNGLSLNKYNKTTVYNDDCECRIAEVSCNDD